MTVHAAILTIPNGPQVAAPIINPDGQTIVDVHVANDAVDIFLAQVAPAEKVGDELVIRLIPSPAPWGQTIWLQGAFTEDNIATKFSFNGDSYYGLQFTFDGSSDKLPCGIVLKSLGKNWLVLGATKGVAPL